MNNFEDMNLSAKSHELIENVSCIDSDRKESSEPHGLSLFVDQPTWRYY